MKFSKCSICLSIFQIRRVRDDNGQSILVEQSLPLILLDKVNEKDPDFTFLFVGTSSWSDKDFLEGFEHFRWAVGFIDKYSAALQSNDNHKVDELIETWISNCASYFDTFKPCSRWFSRLRRFVSFLYSMLPDSTLNWWFNDFILMPTIDFGKIKSKELLWNESIVIWKSFVSKLKAKKSLLIFVFGQTTGKKGIKDYTVEEIQQLSDVKLVPFEKDWSTFRTIYNNRSDRRFPIA